MKIFDDIDSVPWSQLHHAYGPATDVPDLLRALMLPDEVSGKISSQAEKAGRTVFDHITWTLWGNVFHQGTVWQVTAKTVPFLFEILRNGPDNPEQHEFLITYLHHLALGYPDDIFPEIPDPDDEFGEVTELEDNDQEPDYGSEEIDIRSLIWRRDSYVAVERSIEGILPFVESETDRVADAAIALCGSFPRRSDIITPVLNTLSKSETRRGAMAVVSMSVLGDPETPKCAVKHVQSSDELISRLGACATAIYQKDEVSFEVVDILTRPLGELAEMEIAHASTLSTLVGRCLECIGPNHRKSAVDGICMQMSDASAMESLSLTDSLLTSVFPTGLPSAASELSPMQRKAVEAIRDHGAFKVSGGIFANYAGLLSGWGLPQSAEEIDEWLRGGKRKGPWSRLVGLVTR